MKIIQFFSKAQLEWMLHEGIEITDRDYTDDEIVDMIDRLSDLLQEKGIKDDRENAYGNMCGDILNIFGINT